jgi:protein-disulfide isomerase
MRLPLRSGGLGTAAVAILVVTTGWMLSRSAWESWRADAATNEPVPTTPVSIAGANLVGDPAAKVVMVEYSDFECPYCGRFAREVLPQFEQQFVTPGVVVLAFRELPLQSIHPYALRAAEAAECAAQGGKFKPMHDALFGNQQDLDEAGLFRRAVRLDLPVSTFSACLDSVGRQKVLADVSEAESLGVNQTPTFFIGRAVGHDFVKPQIRLNGAQSLSALARAIKSIVNSAG